MSRKLSFTFGAWVLVSGRGALFNGIWLRALTLFYWVKALSSLGVSGSEVLGAWI